jgi:hypothetical protein
MSDPVMNDEWPEAFFEEVVGGWKGEPLERPDLGRFEPVEAIELTPTDDEER